MTLLNSVANLRQFYDKIMILKVGNTDLTNFFIHFTGGYGGRGGGGNRWNNDDRGSYNRDGNRDRYEQNRGGGGGSGRWSTQGTFSHYIPLFFHNFSPFSSFCHFLSSFPPFFQFFDVILKSPLTVCKFQNLTATQIFREINFCRFGAFKNCQFRHFCMLRILVLRNLTNFVMSGIA